ncbi:hypothetical protein PC9H_009062 [Pleurotus ostreatus]|uniref:Uncharacterized protein n=1 Tax=Pleurotus ostreatus TaxID=5322 RepID=A0A8H7DS76_PLEOS|nr:uncharacterized protein PC9H_009062 [Pleurotus ostreatus]KAF7426693.1 hypothetical protein PC9H_009062 [Pleurotus ostreatus]
MSHWNLVPSILNEQRFSLPIDCRGLLRRSDNFSLLAAVPYNFRHEPLHSETLYPRPLSQPTSFPSCNHHHIPGDDIKELVKESTKSQLIQRDYQARTKSSALLPRLITPSRQPSSPSSPSPTKETDAMPEGYEARLPSRRTFTTPSPALQVPRSTRSLSNRPSSASSVVGDATINASPAPTSRIMDDTPSARPKSSLDESHLEMTRSSRTSTGRRGLTHIQMKTRMRKRSMSVENGSPGLSVGSAANHDSPSEFGMLSIPRDDDTTLNGLRSSSSLSNRREGGSSGSERTLDWIAPRAATHALAAAGLLPLDRDRDRDRDRDQEFEQDIERERERERHRRLDLAGIQSVTPTLERTNSRAVTSNNPATSLMRPTRTRRNSRQGPSMSSTTYDIHPHVTSLYRRAQLPQIRRLAPFANQEHTEGDE